MAVWKRQVDLAEDRAERIIWRLVGSLYIDAKITDLPDAVREGLLQIEPWRDVFFFGSIGAGKTYGMAAMVREYVYQGFECKRINFDDFCVQVRSSMGGASKVTEWSIIGPLKDADKLFIDDLGLRSKQETDFAYVTLYSLINKRQEQMLPTFISTNKSIDQLAQAFDSRIASRLSTALMVEMKGADRRQSGPRAEADRQK